MADATCLIDDCTSPAAKRGWCGRHYRRWYAHGDPLYERPTITACQIPDCTRPPRSRHSGLCEMHYYRIRRGGDVLAPELKRNPSGICTADGCDKPAQGTHCAMHRTRLSRHGDLHTRLTETHHRGPDHAQWLGDDVGYGAVHCRLRTHKGKPTYCMHCGTVDSLETYHWALDWERAEVVRTDEATGLRYSTNLDDYISLCVCCHWRFDRKGER